MSLDFAKFANEGNHFMNELSRDLGMDNDRPRAGRVLRAVMYVLRDRITLSEALDFLAQLPMPLKAVFAENWKYREKPKHIRHYEDFLDEVMKEANRMGEGTIQDHEEAKHFIKTVFEHLHKYVTKGELDDIVTMMPEEIKPLFAMSY